MNKRKTLWKNEEKKQTVQVNEINRKLSRNIEILNYLGDPFSYCFVTYQKKIGHFKDTAIFVQLNRYTIAITRNKWI